MNKPQPIETAPKDGTQILMWGRPVTALSQHGDHLADKRWMNAQYVKEDEDFELSGRATNWQVSPNCHYEIYVEDPTHWMPLPDEPVSAEDNPVTVTYEVDTTDLPLGLNYIDITDPRVKRIK